MAAGGSAERCEERGGQSGHRLRSPIRSVAPAMAASAAAPVIDDHLSLGAVSACSPDRRPTFLEVLIASRASEQASVPSPPAHPAAGTIPAARRADSVVVDAKSGAVGVLDPYGGAIPATGRNSEGRLAADAIMAAAAAAEGVGVGLPVGLTELDVPDSSTTASVSDAGEWAAFSPTLEAATSERGTVSEMMYSGMCAGGCSTSDAPLSSDCTPCRSAAADASGLSCSGADANMSCPNGGGVFGSGGACSSWDVVPGVCAHAAVDAGAAVAAAASSAGCGGSCGSSAGGHVDHLPIPESGIHLEGDAADGMWGRRITQQWGDMSSDEDDMFTSLEASTTASTHKRRRRRRRGNRGGGSGVPVSPGAGGSEAGGVSLSPVSIICKDVVTWNDLMGEPVMSPVAAPPCSPSAIAAGSLIEAPAVAGPARTPQLPSDPAQPVAWDAAAFVQEAATAASAALGGNANAGGSYVLPSAEASGYLYDGAVASGVMYDGAALGFWLQANGFPPCATSLAEQMRAAQPDMYED